ncbi:MAG: GNAT family N-acetyltransferase [Micromonosporaceae bacterium]|nr:GNAT family N-acetyltransferase [Micromonosporaceae bacterium]
MTGQLERIAAEGWPAPDVSHLGDWLLRAAGGWTARANSALPVGSPGRPLAAAVDAVAAWYSERGLQPAIMIPGPIGGRVTAEVRRRGWVSDPPVLFMTAPLGTVVAAAAATSPAPAPAPAPTPSPSPSRGGGSGAEGGGSGAVRLDRTPSESWLAIPAAARGLPGVGRAVICGVPSARFSGTYDEAGNALAIGRGVLSSDGRWLGLSLLSVLPSARRRGHASAQINALAAWAVSAGATHAYLQVVEDNAGAIALYDRLGFTTHHRYQTWRQVARTG